MPDAAKRKFDPVTTCEFLRFLFSRHSSKSKSHQPLSHLLRLLLDDAEFQGILNTGSVSQHSPLLRPHSFHTKGARPKSLVLSDRTLPYPTLDTFLLRLRHRSNRFSTPQQTPLHLFSTRPGFDIQDFLRCCTSRNRINLGPQPIN